MPHDPNLKLVVVFESTNLVEIALVKGALEEAGIPFFGLNQISTLVQEIDPMLRKLIRIQVASDREQEARAILAMLETPTPLSEG